ncbi:response regulator [Akkermansiaceae bacterium]|nr:response regulator [Akkermansiaceae bacterium]
MSQANESYDYQRHAILFVDDEANSRKYFKRLFGREFRILEAEDGVEALKVFRENSNDIGIIVTDQRMPNETGVGFLSKIATDYPDVIKILSTAYADIDAAIGSVNKGGIFRYITKPWDIPQLEVTLRRAMEFYILKRERDSLLSAKMLAIGNVLVANRLAAFAFVPVCSAIPCAHASEAIASFVRLCISSPDFVMDPKLMTTTPDLTKLHSRQIELATMLESALPEALSASGIDARAAELADSLGATVSKDDTGSIKIRGGSDPTPAMLESLLGGDTGTDASQAAIRALASHMAIHDAGYFATRKRSSTLVLEIAARPESKASGSPSPGSEAAKWLFEDELLVSAALGIL